MFKTQLALSPGHRQIFPFPVEEHGGPLGPETRLQDHHPVVAFAVARTSLLYMAGLKAARSILGFGPMPWMDTGYMSCLICLGMAVSGSA